MAISELASEELAIWESQAIFFNAPKRLRTASSRWGLSLQISSTLVVMLSKPLLSKD